MNNVSYLLKQKMLFIPLLLFMLLGCQSFKSRTPQSAGFGGYCPECLVKNIDKDLAQLQNVLKVDTNETSKQLKYYYTAAPPRNKCAEGFIKGRSFRHKPKDKYWFNDLGIAFKSCLNKKKLPETYYTSTTKCAEGYIEGNWFTHKTKDGYKDYDSKKCIKK